MPAVPAQSTSAARAVASQGTVLVTLASGQFLMALDSSVMNVSIATVAEDLGTTVTGIQSAITLYTLVMASFMITGGKVGQLLGRKRAFAIGCVIYGAGSMTTALSPNLAVLMFGWSLLEGIGAALIMPAIVALVASNFDRAERPRAYGIVAAFGAIAVAVGPLIGGLLTTYASWRWVFAGEVLIVVAIVLAARRMVDVPADHTTHLDLVGTLLSATGLGLIVFGILRAGVWGFVNPKPEAPVWLGLSPVVWLLFAGGLILVGFVMWERREASRSQRCWSTPPCSATGCSVADSRPSSSSTCCSRAVLRGAALPLGGPGPVGRSTRAFASCRSRWPSCWLRWGFPRCSRTHHLVEWCGWASCCCSPASCCCSPGWTSAPAPRWSPGRCCSPGWVSARWRPSWEA